MIQLTSPRYQGRIIDKWHFSDDWIGSPQDRCRYPSFRSLCYFGAGLDTDRAASLFGVDADTVASWGAADQAPPQVWRTLLALAGEFEAISARWKGWRIHQGKLHAPDLADGFTTGQIRALPFLQGALDAYRRQAIPNRPDASTVHDWKGRSPLGRGPGVKKPLDPARSLLAGSVIKAPQPPDGLKQPDGSARDPALTRSAPFLLLPLGRVRLRRDGLIRCPRIAGATLGSASSNLQDGGSIAQAPEVIFQHQGNEAVQGHIKAISLSSGTAQQVRRKAQCETHGAKTPGNGDVKVTSHWHHPESLSTQGLRPDSPESTPESFDPGFDFVGSIDKPQELDRRGGEGETRRRGATALPESLPLPGAGRKRPTGGTQKHRQGRIIDIMLNNMFCRFHSLR
jgi:hypothetical protein